jgi:hypothetical protein
MLLWGLFCGIVFIVGLAGLLVLVRKASRLPALCESILTGPATNEAAPTEECPELESPSETVARLGALGRF